MVKQSRFVVIFEQLFQMFFSRHWLTIFVTKKGVDVSHQDVVGDFFRAWRGRSWLARVEASLRFEADHLDLPPEESSIYILNGMKKS